MKTVEQLAVEHRAGIPHVAGTGDEIVAVWSHTNTEERAA